MPFDWKSGTGKETSAVAALSSKSFQLPGALQLPPEVSWHLAAALGQG